MNTYKVIARLEYMGGVEVKPYTVTAYTEDSARTKAKGEILSEIDLDELLEIAITDVCKV